MSEGEGKGSGAARARVIAARDAASRRVSDGIGEASMPGLIRDLLAGPWENVLVLTHLRQGPESSEWRQAVGFIEDMIWSGQPKRTAADVARLQSMLPKLSEQLRAGMEMVAFPMEDIQAFFEDLKATYQEQLEEKYRSALHMPSVRSAAKLRFISHLQPVEIPKDDGAADASGREARLRRVRREVQSLERGAWLEFTDADGEKVRAKLSWRSPISRKLLFVTAQGVKLADKSEDELAAEIADGETLILDSRPVFNFDRKK